MDMEREDFLPFCRRQIEHLYADVVETIERKLERKARTLRQPVEDVRPQSVQRELYLRAMQGFLTHHYPVGGICEVLGVPGIVKESRAPVASGIVDPGEVVLLVKGPKDTLDEVRLPLAVAMGAVWQRYGLETRA